jgi:hypothetical protein
MATRALDVAGKFGLYAVGFKFVAEAAVRTEAGGGIGPRSYISVPGMRKIGPRGARWQHIGFVARSAVTLSAE